MNNSSSTSHGQQGYEEQCDAPASIKFLFEDVSLIIPPADFANDWIIDALRSKIEQAESDVDTDLSGLRGWATTERFITLDALASFAPINKLRFLVDGTPHSNLFDATLACLKGAYDLSDFENAKMAALETAVLLNPNALDVAVDCIAKHLSELGIKGVSRRELLSDAKKIRTAIEQAGRFHDRDGSRTPVRSLLPDAPVDDACVVPRGWAISPNGIAADGHDTFCPTPLLIVDRQLDVHTSMHSLTVAWLRDGAWHRRSIDRVAMVNSRTIVDELAPYGAGVTSNNSKQVLQYLFDFESANSGQLPVTRVTHTLGWQGVNGEEGFLLGAKHIRLKRDANKPRILFRGSDDGDSQIAEGLHQQGRYAKWLAAIGQVKDFPIAKLVLFSSLVPPLLPILNTRNFVVDLAGRTTIGKTTMLRIAASVWGNPDEEAIASVMKSWDTTAVWRERAPAVLNTLPFILDDTKRARNSEDIAKTIYAIAHGLGRGRGSIKGLARLTTWQTVLLTSGEQPVTSFTEDGGTRARVLSLWGSPFAATGAKVGKLARNLNEVVMNHYGHAGERFVKYLLKKTSQWKAWERKYECEVRRFEKLAAAENNPYAGRMATHFAAIATAAWLAVPALGLPWEYEDPIEPLWAQLVKGAAEANRAAAALRYVMDWAYSHQCEFSGRETSGHVPSGGWAGRWDKSIPSPDSKTEDNWSWIGFIPAKLAGLLKDWQFDPESTMRQWKDDGWLLVTEPGRRTYKARIGKEKRAVSLIAIHRTAIEEADVE